MKSLEDMSDYLNPLLVKEVRQLFHSKQYLVLIALFLLGELSVLYVMMLNYKDMTVHTKEHLGEMAFAFQCIGMSLAVFIVSVFRTCQTFNNERLDKNLDYTRLCSITPFTVAIGKLLSSVVNMLVIVALILPFMVISYFLRGISLQNIMIWLAILIPQYIVGIQVAVFIGSIGKKGAEALLFLAVVVVMPFVIGMGVSVTFMGRTPKIEQLSVTLAIIAIALFSQAFAWTVAMISRSKSNIMFHPRLCASAICILYPLLFIILVAYAPMKLFSFSRRPENILMVITTLMSMVIGTIQLAFVFEREQPGTRVMAERPKRRFFRAVMFFLSSGRAGGISLSIILMMIEAVIIQAAYSFFTVTHESISPLVISMYVLFYCLFAVLLNRFFPKINTILGFVISVAIWFVLPTICVFSYGVMTKMADEALFEILFTTPLYMFASGDVSGTSSASNTMICDKRLIVPLVICVLLLLPLCKYIILEFVHFIRDEEEDAR